MFLYLGLFEIFSDDVERSWKKQTNMTLKITSFSASLSQFVGGLQRFKRMFKHNFVATRAGKNIHTA